MKTFLNFYSHNAKSFDDTTIKNIKKEFEIFLESFELDDDDTKNKKNFQIGAIEAIYYVWLEKYKSGNTVKITKQIEENIKKDISAFQKSNRSTTSKDSIEARIEIARKWIS
jgi:hypothetical protein